MEHSGLLTPPHSGTRHPPKRLRMERSAGDSQKDGGSSSGGSGNTTSLIVGPEIERLICPTSVDFVFKRKLRVWFNNSFGKGVFAPSSTYSMYNELDCGLYELPINHISLYMTQHHESVIANFNGYRIVSCGIDITHGNVFTFQEIDPSTSTKYFNQAGQMQPSLQHFHTIEEPPFRGRFYTYDEFGITSNKKIDNGYKKVAELAKAADAAECSLPRVVHYIQRKDNFHGHPQISRAVTDHNYACPPIHISPNFIGGYRRLRQAQSLANIISSDPLVHFPNMAYNRPFYTSDTLGKEADWIAQDFLAEDPFNPEFFYKDERDGSRIHGGRIVNYGHYFRLKPMTSLRSSNSEPISYVIPMKCYMDIDTTIVMEAKYDTWFQDAEERFDNMTMMSRSTAHPYMPQAPLSTPSGQIKISFKYVDIRVPTSPEEKSSGILNCPKGTSSLQFIKLMDDIAEISSKVRKPTFWMGGGKYSIIRKIEFMENPFWTPHEGVDYRGHPCNPTDMAWYVFIFKSDFPSNYVPHKQPKDDDIESELTWCYNNNLTYTPNLCLTSNSFTIFVM